MKPPTGKAKPPVKPHRPNHLKPARYTKRPVTIEAMQWDGTAEGAAPVIDWVLHGGARTAHYVNGAEVRNEHGEIIAEAEPAYIAIDTLEGTMHATAGDWIIRGVQGEHYPCKPDIFAATYEAADHGA